MTDEKSYPVKVNGIPIGRATVRDIENGVEISGFITEGSKILPKGLFNTPLSLSGPGVDHCDETCCGKEEFVPEDGALQRDLAKLLNRYSAENVAGSRDSILAKYLLDTLKRAEWLDEDHMTSYVKDDVKLTETIAIFNRHREQHPDVAAIPLPDPPVIKGVADAHPFHHNI